MTTFKKIITCMIVLLILSSCSKEANLGKGKEEKPSRQDQSEKTLTKTSAKAKIDKSWTKKLGAYGIYYKKGDVTIIQNYIEEDQISLEDLVSEVVESLAFWDLENFYGNEKITEATKHLSNKKIKRGFSGKNVYDIEVIGGKLEEKLSYMKLIVQDDFSYLVIVSDMKDLVENSYHEIYQR